VVLLRTKSILSPVLNPKSLRTPTGIVTWPRDVIIAEAMTFLLISLRFMSFA